MAYLVPSEFVTKIVDAGESKVFMSTRDTVIRAYMAGAILALAAWFAITMSVNTGQPIIGAILFPVGFCMLYLFGFDLLTGVFVLVPLAWIDRRPGVTIEGVLRNWGLVFVGNFAGAFTVAVMMAIVFTFGFSSPPDKVGVALANIGVARTLGYEEHGAAGMLTLFIRGVLSPAGHAAWTGLSCWGLWRFVIAPSGKHFAGFVGMYALAVALHTAWDGIGGRITYAVVGAISIGLLLYGLKRAQRKEALVPA